MVQPTIVITRPGIDPLDQDGPTTYWPDGLTTTVLAYSDGHISWFFADEVDTLIEVSEALRHGEAIDKTTFDRYLDTALKVEHRTTAIIDELLTYARELDPATGKARMSWREIAGGVELHHTTLWERFGRSLSRRGSSWRQWLIQKGPRADMPVITADEQD